MSMFRQKALAKMSSPERIDELVRVTSPLGWLALATVSVLLIGVIVWSIVGTIPTRVAGSGILAAGDYYPVPAPATGVLTELRVKEGDTVLPGQVVAVLSEPEAGARRIAACATAQAKAAAAQSQMNQYLSNVSFWDSGIADLEHQIVQRRTEREQLLPKLNNPNYKRNQVQNDIAIKEKEIDQLEAQINRTKMEKSQAFVQANGLRAEANVAQKQCDSAASLEAQAQHVKAPEGGIVQSISTQAGVRVQAGQTIVRLLREYSEPVARFYVSEQQGAAIREGMPVEVSPASVKKEEHGFRRGKVTAKSRETQTNAEMMAALGQDENKVKEMLQQGPVYAVTAELTSWSGRAPKSPLVPNEKIQVNVITEEVAPYTLVIPLTKKVFGMS